METAARPSGAGMSVQEGLASIGATALFEKVLTASDTAGRIIIPKVCFLTASASLQSCLRDGCHD